MYSDSVYGLRIDLDSHGLMQRELRGGRSLGDAVAQLAKQHPQAHGALLSRRGKEPLGWLDLPAGGPWVVHCLNLAAELREKYSGMVVCGIGGSALGTQAVLAALDWPLNELLPVSVLDNIDPSQVSNLVDELDLANTCINVISKSGTTLETMAGFFYLLQALEQLGLPQADIDARIVATTDPEQGILRPLARKRGWERLAVPADVGGRYSVLSPVGLLPLAYAGIDVPQLLEGAEECQAELSALKTEHNPAWRLAAAHHLLETEGGIDQTLHYIYGDPLVLLGDWFRQLWAESLGKAVHTDGSAAQLCMTPLVARGTTDQHSQNQLYMEGPDNKLYGVIGCESWTNDPAVHVPADTELDSERYYDGMTFGSLLAASRDGTRDALVERGRPVYEISFEAITPRAIGAYLQFWMLATAYAGDIYQINAFDQPGVERSKVITKEKLKS
jgi:glucose-6-phosphate isomerase